MTGLTTPATVLFLSSSCFCLALQILSLRSHEVHSNMCDVLQVTMYNKVWYHWHHVTRVKKSFSLGSDMYKSRIVILWKPCGVYLFGNAMRMRGLWKHTIFMKAVYVPVKICQSHPTGHWHCSKSNWLYIVLTNNVNILFKCKYFYLIIMFKECGYFK